MHPGQYVAVNRHTGTAVQLTDDPYSNGNFFSSPDAAIAAATREASRRGGFATNPGVVFARLENGKRGRKRGNGVTRNRARKPRRNPALVTFGNPGGKYGKVVSKDVCEIRYRHADDNEYYQHTFKVGQVSLYSFAGSKTAVLRRVDGKPLIGEY